VALFFQMRLPWLGYPFSNSSLSVRVSFVSICAEALAAANISSNPVISAVDFCFIRSPKVINRSARTELNHQLCLTAVQAPQSAPSADRP
jgi:hypothetical protein